MDGRIESLERLTSYFKALPGVGLKTAQRYAYFIVDSEKDFANGFSSALIDVKEKVKYCNKCGNFTDDDVCDICKNRSAEVICVVKEPKDVISIERVKSANFVYHVLHGTISPLDGRGPDDIRIKELLERIRDNETKEVIMATNPDVEGDATAMYIARLLAPLGVKVTRIAQGISMGSELEFADEVTLTRALESRREI